MVTTLRSADLGKRVTDTIYDALRRGDQVVLERDGVAFGVVVTPDDLAPRRLPVTGGASALDEIHERNRHFPPEEVERDAEAAVQAYRRECRARKAA